MAAVNGWFQQMPAVTASSHFEASKQEYSLEITVDGKKLTVNKQLFEDPVVAKCFRVYPLVRQLADKKAYTVLRNKKEIAKSIPWDELVPVLKKATDSTGLPYNATRVWAK